MTGRGFASSQRSPPLPACIGRSPSALQGSRPTWQSSFFLLFKPRISFSHLQGTQSAVSSFKSSFVDDQYVRELSSRAFFNAGGITLGLLPSSPSSLGNPFLAHLALLLAVTLHRLPSLGPSDNNITTERRASSVTRSAHYFTREADRYRQKPIIPSSQDHRSEQSLS